MRCERVFVPGRVPRSVTVRTVLVPCIQYVHNLYSRTGTSVFILIGVVAAVIFLLLMSAVTKISLRVVVTIGQRVNIIWVYSIEKK